MFDGKRLHCPLSSGFHPLCWRMGIKTFCVEAQNARSSRKLGDDLIQWFPNLASHWNLLKSLLKIKIPVQHLQRFRFSSSAEQPGNLLLLSLLGPSWRGCMGEQCGATVRVSRVSPGRKTDSQGHKRFTQGHTASQ